MLNRRFLSMAKKAIVSLLDSIRDSLTLHVYASNINSYDGDGDVWYDIAEYDYTPSANVSEHFNTATFIGNGSTNSITGVGFQPDLVWLKHRSGGSPAATNHYLYDSVRGNTKVIFPNLTLAEVSVSNHITSFDVDGFTLGNDTAANANNANYVAWCFKAGGSPTSSNPVFVDGTGYATLSDAGLADSTNPNYTSLRLSVNTELGFSIVTANAPVNPATSRLPHGLGQEPEMVIQKTIDTTYDWGVWHKDLTDKNHRLRLNQNAAADSFSNQNGGYWTAVNSTDVMYLQDSQSRDQIYYSFVSKKGVSKVGSYTGTGAAGNKIETGFKPAWVMLKGAINSTSGWVIIDSKRNDKYLQANVNSAESSLDIIDFNGDGFTFKGNDMNGSGATYIYLAFAEQLPDGLIEEVTTIDSYSYDGTENFYNYVSSITSTSTSGTFNATTLQDSTATVNFGANGNTEANNTVDFTMTQPVSVDGFLVGESEQSYFGYTGTCKFYGSTDGSTYTLLGSTVQHSSPFALNPTRTAKTATFSATPGYSHFRMTLSNMNRGTYGHFYEFIPSVADNDFDFTTVTGADPVIHLDAGDFPQKGETNYSNTPSTWEDKTSNNNDGTISGAVFDSELGNWLDFDGSNDYVDFGDLAGFGTELSLEVWVNPDATQNQYSTIIDFEHSNDEGWAIYQDNNNLNQYKFTLKDGSSWDISSSISLTSEVWSHLLFTVDSSGGMKSYLNGELQQTLTSFDGLGTTARRLNLGCWGGSDGVTRSRFWNGKIGQIRMYSSALTADEVMQNYRFTKNKYPNGTNGDFLGGLSSSDWNSSGYFDFPAGSKYIQFDGDNAGVGLNQTVSFFCELVGQTTTDAGGEYRYYVYNQGAPGTSYSYFNAIIKDGSNGVILTITLRDSSSRYYFTLDNVNSMWKTGMNMVSFYTTGSNQTYYSINGSNWILGTTDISLSTPVDAPNGRVMLGKYKGNTSDFDNPNEFRLKNLRLFDRILTNDELSNLYQVDK